jgi:ACS family hexuronate transporter-like MFS transporter
MPHAASSLTQAVKIGHYRWVICALIFFATTINYIDRQVIGILKNTLQTEFGWNEIDYSNIVFAFQLAYAIGLVISGRLMDRLGTKIGYAIAVVIWSFAAIAHAEAVVFGPWAAGVLALVGFVALPSVAGFIAARFALGLGEAGNFPAAIKAVAEWFPRQERALATGIFNSGTNVGALLTPLMVPWITVTYGWYWAFVVTGTLGFLWLIIWWVMYERPHEHPRVTPAELAHIRSDYEEASTRIAWLRLLPHPQAWAFALGKFMTDPVWWLYLFWIPDFLNREHHLQLTQLGPPLVAIYLIADVGSIGGGWLSSSLLKRGWTLDAARKTAMLVCAAAVLPIIFAAHATNLWIAVGLIGLAAAAHQGWSANLFTLVSDTFPRRAVGSVVGFGGMAGAVGGMLVAKVTGYLLEWTDSYAPVFLLAGTAYFIALAIIHVLVPTIEPVRLDERPNG